MKESEIKFKVFLDDENIPEKLEWDADEKEKRGYSETKSISVSLWDSEQKNTLRIDLWTKDMPLDEMKRFYIDCYWSCRSIDVFGEYGVYFGVRSSAVPKISKH